MPIRTSVGIAEPLGLTLKEGKANFSLFASHATRVTLCLFYSTTRSKPDAEIPLIGPDSRGIWHVEIEGMPQNAAYAYRVEGKDSDPNRLLSDPYARAFTPASSPWGDFSLPRLPLLCLAKENEPFDWQGISMPKLALNELVIYEMHVRGFTKDPSSSVSNPGSYAAVIEKIPYLKQLGVNAVELMPIFEFDETHSKMVHPSTKQQLPNYWGYSPVSFFVPMRRYASRQERAIEEFKTMVRELHRAKILVILDVVFNHTGEDENYICSFRGIDRSAYYMLKENGEDKNYSGCGNTFEANNFIGQKIILDSLRYWVEEMKVDGFRFDLASILTRGSDGKPLPNPPVLVDIAKDPILKSAIMIAEPWDAAGLYQVGQFPQWGRWSGWDGPFRDHVRRFLKGTSSEVSPFASAICGNETCLAPDHSPLSSINFITAHDGYSLRDLVSYQEKHNLDNGENNRDGTNQNDSWNCGAEGPSDDPEINKLRERQMRNFWLALLLSQGIPMVVMGDEIGHSRNGNNNPYVQDNKINWFDWSKAKQNQTMLRFVSSLIGFRKEHRILRHTQFLTPAEIEWHGQTPNHPNWGESSRFIAFVLKNENPIYAAFNAGFEKAAVALPPLPAGKRWHLVVNTSDGWEVQNFSAPQKGSVISSIEMLPHSALLAKAY